ncbi:M1 family metallopeptidase [Kineosporia sp. J2-2]|uniref:Aminopeptidase N n=1 Tax=Kineosporia corallincola TaxID=2835133 RepID=A0ABS5TB89_9ACTN|nr:M1 family metallopeptidase [Kineosporia corallincola]MBT0768342.1 M1 family metallopeptidase [Kineosporia corallincola]
MRRVSIRTITIAAATAAALTLGNGVADAAATPGAPGAGDVYFPDYGNGGYDVGHYDVRVRYQPATDELTGTTTIAAEATQDLSRFNLDFALDVSSVRVNNRAATFHTEGEHELVVTPARQIPAGSDLNVVVKYAGIPSQVVAGGFTGWTRTADGALAVNEPESAWWWFPSNDHPSDKATYDVSVLAPDDVQVISNGTLTSGPTAELKGWNRWYWRSVKPQATYLTYLAIGKYDIETDTAADGSPIINAFSTSLGDFDGAARAGINRTNEIIETEEQWFGDYPFEAQGGVAAPPGALGFALETQTRPVYDGRFWRRGGNTYVVAHELAHQWFGDSVSLEQWRDIWLNEGFASYAEWLWSEHEDEGTPQELFDFVYASYPADDEFWQVLPGDPGSDKVFDGAVYDRGALTLQALRVQIGDQAFFEILHTWLADHRYGNGTTDDFIALAEKISGQDLTQLFTTWLFTAGRPDLSATTKLARSSIADTDASPAQPRSWDRIQQVHQAHAALGAS